jgi:hypothetical protein
VLSIAARVRREIDMVRSLFVVWLVLETATPAHAGIQDSKSANQAVSPSDQLTALQKEYSDATDAYLQAKRQIPASDQAKHSEIHPPDRSAYTKRIQAIADANPKTDVAARALYWIAQENLGTPVAYEAFGRLIEDHSSSDALAVACDVLCFDPSPGVEGLLERARKQGSSTTVRGYATFAMGKYLLRASKVVRDAGDQPGDAEKRAELAKRAEALFDEVTTTYPKVPFQDTRTLGDAAQAELFELRDLALGRVAPEIAGEDLDGVKFRLSDYRGKVVVLDFWGNW